MSWLWLKGEIIHCSECEASFEIKYVDAPRNVQVGDFNVIKQMELNQLYKGSGNGLDSTSPMFYHVVALCENCLKKIDQDLYYIPKEDHNFTILMQEYDAAREQYDQQVKQCIESFLEGIRATTLEQFINKALESISSTNNNKKKKMRQLVDERKQYVKNCILSHFEKSEEVAALVFTLTESGIHFTEHAHQFFDAFAHDITILERIDLDKPRTLNPIISYPNSIVQPILQDRPSVNYYQNSGYTVKNIDVEVANYFQKKNKGLRKDIRQAAAKRISDLDAFLHSKSINQDVFMTEKKIYECLRNGNYEVEVIQCNECGIAFRRIGNGDFVRVSHGVFEREKVPFAKYINCLCETCFDTAKLRQMDQEFKEIKVLKESLNEKIIPAYRTSVAEQYGAYVEMFSDVDLDQLKSDKDSNWESIDDLRDFLLMNKHKILKSADSFVRSNTRFQLAELNKGHDRLIHQYDNFKNGCFGYYEFYEIEAKLNPVNTNQNHFYPYRTFNYKDDFSIESIMNVSSFHKKCFDGVLEKVIGNM